MMSTNKINLLSILDLFSFVIVKCGKLDTGSMILDALHTATTSK